MCSDLPKEFQKTTEVLPFTKYGLSSIEDFRKAQKDVQHLEWLKKIGLNNEEVKLYQENEAGLLDPRKKVESSALKSKLDAIYNKINDFQSASGSSRDPDDEASPSISAEDTAKMQNLPIKTYPEDHPINNLNKLDDDLFGHHKNDDMIPITKRRKILRRLERKKERLHAQQKQPMIPVEVSAGSSKQSPKPGSLWDMQEVPDKRDTSSQDKVIGPKKQTMYTIKDNKILRLEPLSRQDDDEEDSEEEYQAVNIMAPINPAEEQLLEGTKMSLDDIRKIDRFKDYEPGLPSKTLYLKNIAPSVSQEQLSLLFNQFLLDNGGPIDLRLMSGRMRGQAFVTFQYEDLAIQALDEIHGTILSGQPIIAEFGRNSNRIQIEENR